MITQKPINKRGRPFSPAKLILRVHPQQHPIALRGRTAQVAYMLLQDRNRPHSADEMGLRLIPPSTSRQASQGVVYEAIAELRKLAPHLLYKAGWGKGWRIASDVRVDVIWRDPGLFLPAPNINDPHARSA